MIPQIVGSITEMPTFPSMGENYLSGIETFHLANETFDYEFWVMISQFNAKISEFNAEIPSPQTDSLSNFLWRPDDDPPIRSEMVDFITYSGKVRSWSIDQEYYENTYSIIVDQLRTMMAQLNAQVKEGSFTTSLSGMLPFPENVGFSSAEAYAEGIRQSFVTKQIFCSEFKQIHLEFIAMIDLYNYNLNLQAYFEFNQTSGAPVDSAGKVTTLVIGSFSYVPWGSGRALTSAGDSLFASVILLDHPTQGIRSTSSVYTVSFKFKLTESVSAAVVVGPGGEEVRFENGSLIFRVGATTASVDTGLGNTFSDAHEFIIRVNGVGNDVDIFVDKVKKTTAYTGTFSFAIVRWNGMGYTTGQLVGMGGTLDDLRLYDGALTDEQLGIVEPLLPPLLSYFKFNQTTGFPIDEEGNVILNMSGNYSYIPGVEGNAMNMPLSGSFGGQTTPNIDFSGIEQTVSFYASIDSDGNGAIVSGDAAVGASFIEISHDLIIFRAVGTTNQSPIPNSNAAYAYHWLGATFAEFHKFVVRRNGAGNNVSIFVDDTELTTIYVGTLEDIPMSCSLMFIRPDSSNHLIGSIDELKFFDGAVTNVDLGITGKYYIRNGTFDTGVSEWVAEAMLSWRTGKTSFVVNDAGGFRQENLNNPAGIFRVYFDIDAVFLDLGSTGLVVQSVNGGGQSIPFNSDGSYFTDINFSENDTIRFTQNPADATGANTFGYIDNIRMEEI